MIIYNILFYIKCVEQLSQFYDKAEKTIQQKTISDMVKIWLFYNSSSKSFWTGMTSTEAEKITDAKKVKEHLFSNLSSAKYMLSKNSKMHVPIFCNLSKVEKICEIIKFMQWNYTTSKENQKLKPEQDYAKFYTEHQGDPAKSYVAAKIKLTGTKTEKANHLSKLFKKDHQLIIEIKLKLDYLKQLINNDNSVMLSKNNIIFIYNGKINCAIKDISQIIIDNMSEKEKKDNDLKNVCLDKATHVEVNELFKKILKLLNGSISIHKKEFESSVFCVINNDKTTTNSV